MHRLFLNTAVTKVAEKNVSLIFVFKLKSPDCEITLFKGFKNFRILVLNPTKSLSSKIRASENQMMILSKFEIPLPNLKSPMLKTFRHIQMGVLDYLDLFELLHFEKPLILKVKKKVFEPKCMFKKPK